MGRQHAGVADVAPWSLCTTPDGSTVVIISQESDGTNKIGSVYGRVRAMVYRNAGGLMAAPETWTLSKVFDLGVPFCNGWDQRFAAVDPGGNVLLYVSPEGAFRYSLADGARIGRLPLSPAAARPSDDGQYVAGVETESRALTVFEIATGTVALSIPMSANTAAACLSQDSARLVAGDGKHLREFDVSSGKLIREMPSSLLPIAFPAGGGDRFVGLQLDAADRGDAGNLVLADTNDARVMSVVTRGGRAACVASFSPDGRAFGAVLQRWRADVFRSLAPEQIEAALTVHASPTLERAAVVAPPIAAAVIAPATRPVGVIDATDVQELSTRLDKPVVVQGVVLSAKLTTRGDALNIDFNGPDGMRLFCWVPPPAMAKFQAALGPNFEATLPGREIIAKGVLARYGGRRAEWKQRVQLTLNDPAQLQFVTGQQ
jgi:hypothetical protein